MAGVRGLGFSVDGKASLRYLSKDLREGVRGSWQ